MSRQRPALCALVLSTAVLVAAPCAARAGTIEALNARIVAVTVYPDRAEIVREAEVRVPAGTSQIVFAGLPLETEPDSLRVSAKGVAAVLGALEFKVQAGEARKSAEFLAAEKQVKALEAQAQELDAADASARELADFLRSLKATAGTKTGQQVGEGKLDVASLTALYAFLRTGFEDLSKADLARKQQRADLAEALNVARAKRDAAGAQGSIRRRVATLDVDAAAAGTLTVSLAYVAQAANWRPAYRASLDAAKAEVELVCEAVVRQTSGEDWSAVQLTLSTAAPASGVEPPQLDTWLLRPVVYEKRARLEKSGMGGGAMGDVRANAPMTAAPMGEDKEVDAVVQTAEVVHSEYNVSFAVAGRVDVPADGADHRVTLRREALPATLAYRTAPAANAQAFTVAKLTSPKDYPLLAGPMRVIAGSAYLGEFGLDQTPPGAELQLPFGADNRVKVTRVVLPESRTTEGFGGKDRQVAFAFKTTVENLRDRAITIAVEDRVPVSEDERITVKRGPGTTAGFKELADRPGILEWTLTLQPKEKRELVLEYTVRWPKDLVIPGL